MSTAILPVLLIIAIGYSVTNWLPLQYRVAKLSGYRQYGAIILYGLWMLIVVAVSLYVIKVIADPAARSTDIGSVFSGFMGFVADGILTISVVSLAVSSVIQYSVNKYYGDDEKRRKLLYRINLKSRHELDIFLLESAIYLDPLLLITKAGKVYFGWVVETHNHLDERENQYIKIQPFASGYQTEQQQVVFNVDYMDAYIEEMALIGGTGAGRLKGVEIFQQVIPRQSIKSAHFFDKDRHDKYFKAQTTEPSAPAGQGN